MKKQQEDELGDELFEIEWKMMEKVDILVSCKWDSDTIKYEVEQLCKQRNQLQKELYDP